MVAKDIGIKTGYGKNKVSVWRRIAQWFLKDNEAMLMMYNQYYKAKNGKQFWIEIKRRENLSIFEYEEHEKEIPFNPIEKIKDTNFYGHAMALKSYAGVNKFNYALEHGLYYDNYVSFAEKQSTTKRIMTFSKIREDVITREIGKPVVAIGPYIHYADSLLSEDEIVSMKQELGKTLIVFPVHSAPKEVRSFDINELIFRITEFKNSYGFDTVLVNMYYLDIRNTNYAKLYEEAGFRVTTAGNHYDINFVRRLKSIILLADYTISNGVGTHTGYCVYLRKPHYIIDNQAVEKSRALQGKEIASGFIEYHEHVTAEQCELASKYYGFDCIKSKKELNVLLDK